MNIPLKARPSSLPISQRLRVWLGGSYAPYLYIAPFFVFFLAFGFYPLAYALRLSFTEWRGAGEPLYIGLENYTFLLSNSYFWNSLQNSAVLWLLIVPLQTLMAVFAASLLSRQIWFRSFFRVVFLIPYLVPLVAVAQIWLILFDKNFGAINVVLQGLGIEPIGWLTTGTWSKPTMALLVFWKGCGFAVLIMLAAIQNISQEIYESASLDGANGFQQFFRITIPLMRRSIVFFMIISTLGILQMFAEPYILTQGGPYNSTVTAGFALFRYTRNLDLGTGAANSFLLMIIVVVISLVMLRMLREKETS
ncbi:MAG: sugar ABC transporter permease [Chloroflexi bacterium]|nr:sugar ABC transporter permease [Chloroflexota bacterium]